MNSHGSKINKHFQPRSPLKEDTNTRQINQNISLRFRAVRIVGLIILGVIGSILGDKSAITIGKTTKRPRIIIAHVRKIDEDKSPSCRTVRIVSLIILGVIGSILGDESAITVG
jgi:uncharacterized membrane protein YeaQ/YmgE (transglycosylase-associated protein family)